jgi:hypothetical protein
LLTGCLDGWFPVLSCAVLCCPQAVAVLSEALNALSEKLETSLSFDTELTLVKTVMEPLSDLDDVITLRKLLDLCSAAAASHASGGGGVATAAELASEFDDVMVAIRKAEYLPDSSANSKPSMIESALATLADRAKIKPTGMTAGDTALALLARAQYHVHRGELDRAVTELDQLSGLQVRTKTNSRPLPPSISFASSVNFSLPGRLAVLRFVWFGSAQAKVASSWLQGAKARLALDNGYRSLQQTVSHLNASAIA